MHERTNSRLQGQEAPRPDLSNSGVASEASLAAVHGDNSITANSRAVLVIIRGA
jgi:hypothetical protein